LILFVLLFWVSIYTVSLGSFLTGVAFLFLSGQFARASPFLLLFISLVGLHMDNGKSYERNTTAEFNTTWGWNPT
jgi:hypothetical protein